MAAGLCYGSCGGGAQVAFHHQVDAYDTTMLIGALEGLRGFLAGQKATLLWDGLPPTAATPCAPGLGASDPGWWWSHCPPTTMFPERTSEPLVFGPFEESGACFKARSRQVLSGLLRRGGAQRESAARVEPSETSSVHFLPSQ